jgi:hypothetical protein
MLLNHYFSLKCFVDNKNIVIKFSAHNAFLEYPSLVTFQIERLESHCLSFCPFYLAIAVSILLRFTASDYPIDCSVCSSQIYGFWLPHWLQCLFFSELLLLITPLIAVSVPLRFTASDYPIDCSVCSSQIYGFWLPHWLQCLFFSELLLLITPLIAVSVPLRFTASDYPIDCSVYSSQIYFWLPHWLHCLFFSDLLLLITHWL